MMAGGTTNAVSKLTTHAADHLGSMISAMRDLEAADPAQPETKMKCVVAAPAFS